MLTQSNMQSYWIPVHFSPKKYLHCFFFLASIFGLIWKAGLSNTTDVFFSWNDLWNSSWHRREIILTWNRLSTCILTATFLAIAELLSRTCWLHMLYSAYISICTINIYSLLQPRMKYIFITVPQQPFTWRRKWQENNEGNILPLLRQTLKVRLEVFFRDFIWHVYGPRFIK